MTTQADNSWLHSIDVCWHIETDTQLHTTNVTVATVAGDTRSALAQASDAIRQRGSDRLVVYTHHKWKRRSDLSGLA